MVTVRLILSSVVAHSKASEGVQDAPDPPAASGSGLALLRPGRARFVFASPIVWFFTEPSGTTGSAIRTCSRPGRSGDCLFAGSFALAFVYLAANVSIALRVRSDQGSRAVGIRRSIVRSPTGGIAIAGGVRVARSFRRSGRAVADPGPVPARISDRHHRAGARPGRLLLPVDAALPARSRELGAWAWFHVRAA